ncbi:DNA repair protein rad50 [Balamuthia mandrillaris]
MTTIDKLLIQGIRSFSPQNRNIIEFYQPLTIIVGANGAGKTTVIECLKYATTGNLPPGSRSGQAFIHDTKVAGEREVKAQIKLRFRNVHGKPIVCTRSLQLTQTASKKVCKTLESALQTYNSNGEKVSQSFRCADLDKEIPELIGVSKPILENVIFCHQEESNWPLSEGSSLKKKFDDIFAATRYTKALDTIKKQRKEQAQQIREYKLKLDNLQNQKDHAHQIRKELKNKQKFQASAEEEIKKLQAELEAMEKASMELRQKASSITEALNEVKQLKAVLVQMTKANQATYDQLNQEFEETDEELFALAETFNQELQRRFAAEKDIQTRVQKLNSEKASHEETLHNISEQLGNHKSSLERQHSLSLERDKQIVAFAQRYSLPGFDSPPFNQATITNFLSTTKSLSIGLNKAITNTKNNFNVQNQEIVSALEQVQEQISTIREQIKQKDISLNANKDRINATNREIEQNRRAHGHLAQIEAQLQTKENELNVLIEGFDPDAINQQISELHAEKSDLDAKIKDIGNRIKGLNLEAAARASLSIKRSQCKSKEESYQSKLESKRQAFEELFPDMPTPDRLKVELNKLLSKKRKSQTSHRNRLQDTKIKLSSLTGEENSTTSQLQRLQRQLNENRTKMEAIGYINRPLPDLITETEQKLDAIRKEVAMTQAGEIMYKKFMEMAHKEAGCPLCDRGMEPDMLCSFISKLEQLLARVPTSLNEQQAILTDTEKMHKMLSGLSPVWREISRLEDQDIPGMKSCLQALEQQKANLSKEADELSESLKVLDLEERKLCSLINDADSISRDYMEVKRLQTEIEREERNMTDSGDHRSMEDLDFEQTSLQEKSQSIMANLEQLRIQFQQKQTARHKAESEMHQLKERLLQSKAASDAIVRLELNCKELIEANQLLEEEIEKLKADLDKKIGEKEALVSKRTQQQKEYEEQLDEIQREKDQYQEYIACIENLQKQIGGTSVETLQIKIQQLNDQKVELGSCLQDIATQSEELSAQLDEIREMLATSDIHKRNIEENICYRKQKQCIAEKAAEIKAKEAALDLSSSEAIDFDIENLSQNIRKKHQEANRLIGQRDIFKQQIREHIHDLKKPMYKDIDEQFRQMLIKVKTMEMANSDLEKYHVALDKALMKYHSVKMAEINKIIKELWQQTYKGQDIDTIEIRSDVDSSEGRSSYNYRVIMVKGDTELDMRGRCSAGQKVLASLIIRLALAETFCLHCGILALDEPTTNLDRYNVESFANALVNIISTRRQQRNFQLIVITHDEEFVQLLGRSEHADYYWRVSKDIGGYSTLERQDIRDLS